MSSDNEYENYISGLLTKYADVYTSSDDPQSFMIRVYSELGRQALSLEDAQAIIILGSALIREKKPSELPPNLAHAQACIVKSLLTYKFNRNETKDDPSLPKRADY